MDVVVTFLGLRSSVRKRHQSIMCIQPIKLDYLLPFVMAFLAFHISLSAQQAPDSYILHFKDSPAKIVYVEADLYLEDYILKMSSYGPMPERWPDYVRNLKVLDQQNKELLVEKEGPQWQIKGKQNGKRVKLSYELHVEHENLAWPGGIDGVAFVRPWGIMLSGRSLFVMNGDNKKAIEVVVKLPESWKVSTPWKQPESNKSSFVVSNQLKLQESLLFAGTHQEVVIPRGEFNLKFVLGGEDILKQKAMYVENAQGVLDYYIELMGGNPIPAPGNDLSTAMVMIHQSETLDGEVIGNDLSMFINPIGDRQNQMIGWFLFAHEFYHLWNGKTLRFQDTTTDWFKEGVSNYYTLKALNQVGIANEQVAGMILNNLFYKRYITDSGFGKIAPADAASGFDKDNHWGLVYGGGLFAGVCIDMEIRKRSRNTTSLDSVMRKLYVDYGGKDALIDQNTLLEYVNTEGNTDFTNFIETYIKGTAPIPLRNYFLYAGISVKLEEGQLHLHHNPEKTTLENQIWEGFLGWN